MERNPDQRPRPGADQYREAAVRAEAAAVMLDHAATDTRPHELRAAALELAAQSGRQLDIGNAAVRRSQLRAIETRSAVRRAS